MSPREVSYHPLLISDLAESTNYYRSIGHDVADRFVADYRTVLDSIEWFPLAGSRWHGDVRRRNLKRFPYFVGYAVEPDGLVRILGLADGRRDPGALRAKFGGRV